MGMKESYDRSIIDRTFVVGCVVLVLLPEESGKLAAQYRGLTPLLIMCLQLH